MKAYLILKDGTVFEGKSIGASVCVIGETVFNTGMVGYQEMLTDPSYCGQILTFTYPLIGNYGINPDDGESSRPWVSGVVVKELCDSPSNFRCNENLDSYLKRYNIPGIEGIDTRALTKILRRSGTMNGCIVLDEEYNLNEILQKLNEFEMHDQIARVTCRENTLYEGSGFRVALMDFGVKRSIITSLVSRGCEVKVFSANTSAYDILSYKPDGIMLTNGPGDPKDCCEITRNLKILCNSNIPIFGICLGHQLVALAKGGDTEKLKFGHRGANHPARSTNTGKSYITAQNHGYTVVGNSLDKSIADISFTNLNDGTVEGVTYKDCNVFTVQFHPEAASGPEDTIHLFDEFIDRMKN